MTCASHEHDLGSALGLYAKDHHDQLPVSYFGKPSVGMPQEMMAVTTGVLAGVPNTWEGIGWLAAANNGYVGNPNVFYCPSHHGYHTLESIGGSITLGMNRVYANYHYRGDYDPVTHRMRRIDAPHDTVFLTDGLRTVEDFNHRTGGNRLHGDLAVSWWSDDAGAVSVELPAAAIDPAVQVTVYEAIWQGVTYAE